MATRTPATNRLPVSIGDPKRVARQLERFQRSARALSARYPRLIDKFPEQWVAVYDGKVKANAKTLDLLLTQIERRKLPRAGMIVRYISKSPRTMIL